MKSEKKDIFEKKEALRQKMDIRTTLKVAKCGSGLHLKLPPKIIALYTLQHQDEIFVQMKFVTYCNVRELPKF